MTEIKLLVNKTALQAIVKVNKALIYLYWQLGKKIVETQAEKGWGAKVIQTLSQDLAAAFPNMRGFSVRNLNYMRRFAEAYPDFEIVQPVVAQLSWTHHTILLDNITDKKLRIWYIIKSVEQGWSKRVLQHQIDLKIHESFGLLPNNFKDFLPPQQSDLVQQLFKDEYIFDFIAQEEKRKEKDLEKELIHHITDFY